MTPMNLFDMGLLKKKLEKYLKKKKEEGALKEEEIFNVFAKYQYQYI